MTAGFIVGWLIIWLLYALIGWLPLFGVMYWFYYVYKEMSNKYVDMDDACLATVVLHTISSFIFLFILAGNFIGWW